MPSILTTSSQPTSVDNFVRPLLHNPAKLFGPYVKPGMQALDIGCGGGFASLGLARLVGPGGKVFASDLQQEMLDFVNASAEKAGAAQSAANQTAAAGGADSSR